MSQFSWAENVAAFLEMKAQNSGVGNNGGARLPRS